MKRTVGSRRKLPLVECAHEARRDDEMTPERVAEVLLGEEAGSHLDALEEASLEDIQHIYVLQKIEHGLADEETGRTLSEEEFDQRMAKWLEP